MRVRRLTIENFRGVKHGEVAFEQHTLLVGGNNVGKSTICEALDLVLGPERMFRHPVIDEHDFYKGRYVDDDDAVVEIRIQAVLIDLDDEQQRRFFTHLRRWDDAAREFVDEGPGGLGRSDDSSVLWALSAVFLGRYDRDEDDFVGETFFDHPVPPTDGLDDEERGRLGSGRDPFGRTHKRLCGFVFLRALRTGSRALSLQRGSLLDTILRFDTEGSAQMWQATLDSLRDLDPAIGEIEKLQGIRHQIRENMARFVNLGPGDDATTFFASDLTRQHLREVVRLFIATQPSEHPVPFARQGTGTINMLVFALLAIIADLKGTHGAIFAMEEPEIALPPHTQRRVTRYVLQKMGQSIVTSHSPYVIEQFDPDNVVVLNRDGEHLVGAPIDVTQVKPKTYRMHKKQFAEAILSRAVLVVEGATELAVFDAVSTALERLRGDGYTHIDLAGVSLFNAGNDKSVPRYAPIFRSMDKRVYGVWDKPSSPKTEESDEEKEAFDRYWEAPETGIERVLTKQTTNAVLRRFLDDVLTRDDYPRHIAYSSETADADLQSVAYQVLKVRKGDGAPYGAILIDHCHAIDEVPAFLLDVLSTINEDLRGGHDEPAPPPDTAPPPDADPDPELDAATSVA